MSIKQIENSQFKNPVEEPKNSLTISSTIKAVGIVLGATGLFYLAKATGIFSNVGKSKRKSLNSKDISIKKDINSISLKTNLEGAKQISSSFTTRKLQSYDDKVVKFKEIKVEEFENLSEVKEESVIERKGVEGRRSISIKNPLQDQTAVVNTLFSYTFSNDTFIDSDEHPLTYTAKLDNSSLPSWLNFNSPQRKFFGIPTILTTYPIKVTADNGNGSNVSDMFILIVKEKGGISLSALLIAGGSIGFCVCLGVSCLVLLLWRRFAREKKELRNFYESKDIENLCPNLMKEARKARTNKNFKKELRLLKNVRGILFKKFKNMDITEKKEWRELNIIDFDRYLNKNGSKRSFHDTAPWGPPFV